MTAPNNRSAAPMVSTQNKFSEDYQTTLTPQNVKYFFDIITDHDIDKDTACKASREFNKNSYYIDLDFDCDNLETEDDLMFDIYGSATEAEICLD